MSEEQEQGNQVSQEDRAFAAAIAGTANVVANTGMEANAPITEDGKVKTRGHQQIMNQVLIASIFINLIHNNQFDHHKLIRAMILCSHLMLPILFSVD